MAKKKTTTPKKQLKIEHKPQLTLIERFFKTSVPTTKLNYVNFNGMLILSDIDIRLNNVLDWNNLPFLIGKLLPKAIPPPIEESKEEVKDKVNRRKYTG